MLIQPITGEPTRYYVQSRSRKDIIHVVDVEEQGCSCESFDFRKSCSHLREVNKLLNALNEYETNETYD